MPKISVIIPVYNVEKYLRECLDSVCAQTVKDIEIICVDDGSTDSSQAILNEYAAKDSRFCIICQQNAGSGPARNAALDFASGDYVCFMDADDFYTTPRSLEYLFDAIDKSVCEIAGGGVSIVSDDGASIGQVTLQQIGIVNYRKTQQQYNYQAYLFSRNLIEMAHLRFPNLRRRQDPPFFVGAMLMAGTYCAITNIVYSHRQRTVRSKINWLADDGTKLRDNVSGIELVADLAEKNRLDALYRDNAQCLFVAYSPVFQTLAEIELVKSQLRRLVCRFLNSGKIPRASMRGYVSNVARNEHHWVRRFVSRVKVFGLCLTCETYVCSIYFYLRKKISKAYRLIFRNDKQDALSSCHAKQSAATGQFIFTVSHLRVSKTSINIFGVLSFPNCGHDDSWELIAEVNNQRVPSLCGGVFAANQQYKGEQTWKRYQSITISYDRTKSLEIHFFLHHPIDGDAICPITFSKYAPLSDKSSASYFHENGLLVHYLPVGAISIQKASFFRLLASEIRYDAWLFFRQKSEWAKLTIPIRWLTLCLRPLFLKLRFWLVMDRIIVADDNGLALFRYLVTHRKAIGCRPVFVLHRHSCEWDYVRKIGWVIPYSGFRYRLATLFAEWTITSATSQKVIHPLQDIPDGYRGLANSHQLAFLQHGVTIHDVSTVLNRSYMYCSVFVTAADKERDSIINTPAYGQEKKNVVLTGFPRFDLLNNHRENRIVFMPTWRAYLFEGWDPKTGAATPANGIENSSYFQHLHAILSSKKLIDAAEEMNYVIEFFPHPEVQPLAHLFTVDSRVRILPLGTKYRDVFARGALCVTDYSSAVFDFAWMGKPIVYFQPDNDIHYPKGYFDFSRDGFGPVIQKEEYLVDYIIQMMRRDCPMDEPYLTRAQNFFAFHDHDNCKRVTAAILQESVRNN